MSDYLTSDDISKKFQISQTTIRKYAKSGELQGIKIGNRWRFTAESVDNWIHGNQQNTNIYSPEPVITVELE